jgi:hypothetical protein
MPTTAVVSVELDEIAKRIGQFGKSDAVADSIWWAMSDSLAIIQEAMRLNLPQEYNVDSIIFGKPFEDGFRGLITAETTKPLAGVPVNLRGRSIKMGVVLRRGEAIRLGERHKSVSETSLDISIEDAMPELDDVWAAAADRIGKIILGV